MLHHYGLAFFTIPLTKLGRFDKDKCTLLELQMLMLAVGVMASVLNTFSETLRLTQSWFFFEDTFIWLPTVVTTLSLTLSPIKILPMFPTQSIRPLPLDTVTLQLSPIILKLPRFSSTSTLQLLPITKVVRELVFTVIFNPFPTNFFVLSNEDILSTGTTISNVYYLMCANVCGLCINDGVDNYPATLYRAAAWLFTAFRLATRVAELSRYRPCTINQAPVIFFCTGNYNNSIDIDEAIISTVDNDKSGSPMNGDLIWENRFNV